MPNASAHAMSPLPAPSPYPATDPGFAALPVSDLLASAEELIARIRLCFGISRESFEHDIQPQLHRYASYVHLLPATADNYFAAPGGLLRLGLEVAFFSLQGTDAHIFSGRSTISARRQLEPRWRQATFIGGLCCELHRVLSHVIVTDAAGTEWPSYLEPLAQWLHRRSADRYFVQWRPNAVESRGLGVFALPLVVPAATMQFLGEDNAVIVPHLLASIGGVSLYRDPNVLDSLVRRSLALVIDRNLQANADRYGAPQFGSHLERYLVDAMQRLSTSNPNWLPNREKSRAWLGTEGLFLVWPQAATDVQALLEADQLVGIPKAPATVLEVLLAAGVFDRQPDGRSTWTILPPEAKAQLEAVKLSAAGLLLAGLDPQPRPLAERLVCKPGETRPAPTTAPARLAAAVGTQYSLIEPVETLSAPRLPEGEEKTPPLSPALPPTTQPAAAPAPAATSVEDLAQVDIVPAQLPSPSRSPFSLNAPLRLNPAVRGALVAIVNTLNGPGSSAAACAVADGLFVPMQELERRGIQPALAARALADVRMLVHADRNGPPTVSHNFGGEPMVGLVLPPQCVQGFDPAAFAKDAKAEC